jgi:diguanylate cyclase (GGDEF)-like protein
VNSDYLPKILIIDDSVEIVRFLSLLLRDVATIVFAVTGQEGVQMAERHLPDLILLDVSLPDINGFDVCRQIKAGPDTALLPILFVTAGNNETAELQALQAGAVDFIAKPLQPAIVRARVQTHLALRKQTILLQALVQLDGLTGIFNRRHFDAQLLREVARHRRQDQSLALAMIDVDHFKLLNDTLGHQEGDDCLRKIAAALKAAARRPGETLARYGGEEFAIILPASGSAEAERYGLWIRERIGELQLPHPASASAAHVTVSVGLAHGVPAPGHDAAAFVACADQAMYAAKAAGRNIHRVQAL